MAIVLLQLSFAVLSSLQIVIEGGRQKLERGVGLCDPLASLCRVNSFHRVELKRLAFRYIILSLRSSYRQHRQLQ